MRNYHEEEIDALEETGPWYAQKVYSDEMQMGTKSLTKMYGKLIMQHMTVHLLHLLIGAI